MPDFLKAVLPARQREVWQKLNQQADFLRNTDFYLAGGTALALQLGHRQSVDFDFFTSRKDSGEQVMAWLEEWPNRVIREYDANTVHVELGEVKVSFIGSYKYPLVASKVKLDEIFFGSLVDIGLMKLLAITHRATVRDYIDMAAIFQSGIGLDVLFNKAPEKYGEQYNLFLATKALTSFYDLDQEIPKMIDENLANSWQKIITDEVIRVVK